VRSFTIRGQPLSRALPAWALAALGAAVYLLLDPPSTDLAAQQYRTQLFEEAGFTVWNNNWYGGHHTPAYSVLFPPLGATLGPQIVGALAAIAAAALFARLAASRWGECAYPATLWFAVAILASIVSGRLTFALGVAFGLAALLALASGRAALAVALAFVTPLASPVAGSFLALAALAWGLGGVRERGTLAAVLTLAALAPLAVLGLLFPEGGSEPFVDSAFWPALVGLALVVALLPARERALRIGVGLYALALVASFAFANPLGGNATRLGALLAGPLAVAVLAGRRRPVVIALIALPLAYWSLYPAVRDFLRADGDPSIQRSYHEPLVRFLQRQPGAFRVEIPFTENHWEATHVAGFFPLARGWERQLDRRYNALFYDGDLDAARYRAWLDGLAVRFVALADVPLDAHARDEARLINRGLPYLRPVWRNQHWRVFAVRDAAPLVQRGTGEITLSRDGFEITAARAGVTVVRVRHSRWWTVTAGDACVARDPGGMTRVRVRRAGTVAVQARLAGQACGR